MDLYDLKHTLVPIALFLAIFGIAYLFISARYRERMAMIEKGMDPRTVTGDTYRIRALRLGLSLLGLGLGLLAGNVLEHYYPTYDMAAPGSMLLFGGLGLLTYYLIVPKHQVEH